MRPQSQARAITRFMSRLATLALIGALPLLAGGPPGGSLGALNLYGRYPQAFGVIDRARGLLLGGVWLQRTLQSGEARMIRLEPPGTRSLLPQFRRLPHLQVP